MKNCFDRTPHTMKDWLLLAAGVAALGADVVAALLALSMAPAPVRIVCAGRVTVVIVGVAGRLGCGLAVCRRARGRRSLAVVVLVRIAGGRCLPAAARGGAVVVIVGVAGRLGRGLSI